MCTSHQKSPRHLCVRSLCLGSVSLTKVTESRLNLLIHDVEDGIDEPNAFDPLARYTFERVRGGGNCESRERVACVVVVTALAWLVAQTAMRRLGAHENIVKQARCMVQINVSRELA